MKDEHLKLLICLIKYADFDTLRLIDNFLYSNGLINLSDFNISYKFLCLAVNNNSDIKYQKLEKFLELLLKISTNLSYKKFYTGKYMVIK